MKENQNEQVIQGIVDCFLPLAGIPRQSHHEEAVSRYLYNWALERGFAAQRDEVGNVLFEVPATRGREQAPLCILQGHMDMVIAAEEGKGFDPQKDPITVVNDGNTLRAEGTSLGADDGIGVATALYIARENRNHGPLRIIFTVDEEDGMTGVYNMEAKWLKGAKYLISLDSEEAHEVTVSAAAGLTLLYDFALETAPGTKELSLNVILTGLISGHSGMEIHKGRLNGIKGMGRLLTALQEAGIGFELGKITGGSALNAIPGSASARIQVDLEDEQAVRKTLASAEEALRREYPTETGLKVNIRQEKNGCRVLTGESKGRILRFIWEIFNGVNTMSDGMPGLVESSSNLGLITVSAEDGVFTAGSYLRSSVMPRLREMEKDQLALAEKIGAKARETDCSDAWPMRRDSRLLELVKTAYREQTGGEIRVAALHAGLETGTFARMNPELDMVSLGCDVRGVHSTGEYCDLRTIPLTYGVIEKVLATLE